MGMKVLLLEDYGKARENVDIYFRNRFQFSYVDTVTALDEFLFDMEGYNEYGALVLDLCINMPLFTREEIVKRIPLLDCADVPTECEAHILLYGLDYFKLVIAQRPETKDMVESGRVIFFSGHANKIRSKGIYDEKMIVFRHTALIDRAEENAMPCLFSKLSDIEKKLGAQGGDA